MTAELIAPDGDSMGFNEALGFTVNQYLFAHNVTRERLGELLGVTRTVVSKKVRGQVGWTARDVAVVAGYFGLSVDDLMPRRAGGAPVAGGGGGAGAVPRTGFEPAAFCSEEPLDGIVALQGRQLSLLPALTATPAIATT